MGDMADMALDEMMDEEEARLDYRLGKMTVAEAYERGLVDELGADLQSERPCECPVDSWGIVKCEQRSGPPGTYCRWESSQRRSDG